VFILNDDGSIYQAMEHAREIHPEIDLTEVWAREMVAAKASDTEDATR
jgi:hypothetical protein